MALSIEQLYRQYAGREADPGGLEYWKKQFGSDVDPNEVAVFQRALEQVREFIRLGKIDLPVSEEGKN